MLNGEGDGDQDGADDEGRVEAELEAFLQEAEIEKFRGELVETRGALRDVQRRLRRDIDRLGSWLGAINILLVPLMLAGTAVVLALFRRRKQSGGA